MEGQNLFLGIFAFAHNHIEVSVTLMCSLGREPHMCIYTLHVVILEMFATFLRMQQLSKIHQYKGLMAAALHPSQLLLTFTNF